MGAVGRGPRAHREALRYRSPPAESLAHVWPAPCYAQARRACGRQPARFSRHGLPSGPRGADRPQWRVAVVVVVTVIAHPCGRRGAAACGNAGRQSGLSLDCDLPGRVDRVRGMWETPFFIFLSFGSCFGLSVTIAHILSTAHGVGHWWSENVIHMLFLKLLGVLCFVWKAG